jgi:hypothetical protein
MLMQPINLEYPFLHRPESPPSIFARREYNTYHAPMDKNLQRKKKEVKDVLFDRTYVSRSWNKPASILNRNMRQPT